MLYDSKKPVFNYLIFDVPWNLKFNKQCIQHFVVSDLMVYVIAYLRFYCASIILFIICNTKTSRLVHAVIFQTEK